jgi:suppressor of G2 allele of SKP1
VTPRKIELTLAKAVPEKWTTWGSEAIGDMLGNNETAPASEPTVTASATDAQPGPAGDEDSKPASAPAYPTSSKSGPKNWDTIARDEPDDDDKDVNQFFKHIYKGASEEQRRAMMKSFIESNGTALSTDWNDVKGRHVETIPPDGVEAKKW